MELYNKTLKFWNRIKLFLIKTYCHGIDAEAVGGFGNVIRVELLIIK